MTGPRDLTNASWTLEEKAKAPARCGDCRRLALRHKNSTAGDCAAKPEEGYPLRWASDKACEKFSGKVKA